MLIKVVASGSAGNCYILENDKEALVIECGKPYPNVMKALNFNISKIKGCLVSHTHNDHSKYANQFERSGFQIFKPYVDLKEFPMVEYGGFKVIAFPLEHDVPCYGFYIEHEDIGKLVYASDTEYVKYRFKDINHILIEANYSKQILCEAVSEVKTHIVTGHMEINTACRFVKKNKTDKLKTVVLLHLSEMNSDREQFMDEIQDVANCSCYIATQNQVIELE